MLHINEIAVKELATTLGVDEVKLKAELFVEAEKAPTETKIKDVLGDLKIFKATDHGTLLDNHGKAKYDEGKYKETNQIVKVALGDKAFDTKDMKREDVIAKVTSILKADWEVEHGKAPSEKEKELKSSIEKLQGLVKEKEGALEKLSGELESTKAGSTKSQKISDAVADIKLEATGESLAKQRVVLKNILSSYELRIEDGKDVYYKDGQKLVDNLQNPKTLKEIAEGEAIIFPTVKASNGRGDNSSKQNNQSGELDAELAKCTSLKEVGTLLSGRGLSPISEAGQAVISKWVSAQKKTA